DDIAIWSVEATCLDPDCDGSLPPECGGGDWDDSDATIHPGADEICDDLVDNDCDGFTDDDDADCQGGGGTGGGGEPPAKTDDSGCGCQLPGTPTSSKLGLFGLAALLAGWAGRRRRPRAQP
ncbi:MAG: hypothetical protein DRI90_24070, partial [Deltaproteobacteria bacterium]